MPDRCRRADDVAPRGAAGLDRYDGMTRSNVLEIQLKGRYRLDEGGVVWHDYRSLLLHELLLERRAIRYQMSDRRGKSVLAHLERQ